VTLAATYALTAAILLAAWFALFLRKTSVIDPGDTVFVELLGALAAVTLILFLPRPVCRRFALPMYLSVKQSRALSVDR
jgi:hypothetical protein